MSGQTYISGDRIELRTITEEDIDFLLEGSNHPEVRAYISVFRTPYTEERYRDELWPVDTDGANISLLAVPQEGDCAGEPVGSVQLAPLNDGDGYANFGVWFHPTVWGRGYALEASAHLIEYGFQECRLHRISASVMEPNRDSITLCERLGFVHEGTARDAQFSDGEYCNVERFGLLVEEWAGPDDVLGR